jgi:hypothetical protein
MHLGNEISLSKTARRKPTLELVNEIVYVSTPDRRAMCDGSRIPNPLLAASQELAALRCLAVNVELD